MAKKKQQQPKVENAVVPNEIVREGSMMIHNGLTDALMGFTPGVPGVQLSQVDTLFQNNRWYLVSNMRQLLSEIYVEHGLVQTIVNVPVDDGLRGGVTIKSKQLSPEQIEEIQIYLERESILSDIIGQAAKWNRLFGGSGILIITDQDFTTPLDITKLNPESILEYAAVDMWELYGDQQLNSGSTDAIDAKLNQRGDFYNYYGKKIHKSRVMIMKGLVAPSFVRPRLRGWGFSVIEALVRSVNQYLKSNNLSFEILDEFKVDIFKIEGLATAAASLGGQERIRNRVAMANRQKSFQNAMTMDAKDGYEQKQVNLAGISEIMREIRMQIASDMRMPLTKIFGISSAGFSSGEDDIENYNAMVESDVRAKSKYEIVKIIELKCQKEFGFVPEDISVEFKALRILSGEQEENVKTAKFARLVQARQLGEISSKEFKDACNKDNLFPVQVDADAENLPPPGGKTEKEEGVAPAASGTKSTPDAPKTPDPEDADS